MSRRLARGLIVLAALAAFAVLCAHAPSYLLHQGFPLDDAWIHAVYGRELARSGMLAYNPHTPATGSTAPLWSAIVALPHLVASGAAVVMWVKLLGYGFHVLAALVLYAALRDDQLGRDPWRLGGAVLVALHPDLVSASVSGMEVGLAALAAVSVLYAVAQRGPAAVAAAAAIAVLVRPELAVVALSIPLIVSLGEGSRGVRKSIGAAIGVALAASLLAARNLDVSGLPLPATFYAKVGAGPPLIDAQWMGFAGLLRQVPIVDSLLLLGAALGIAVALLRAGSRSSRTAITAAAAFISGVAFCVVSFALVAPIDPDAFYHQRYVLPVLPLLVGPLPLLLYEAIARALPPRYVSLSAAAVLAALFFLAIRHAPERYAHLANDTQNIDDVQVGLGRALASAKRDDVVWAVDAGAVRYFGNAFVVDMMGLNTPEILGGGAQAFLDLHPARYVEVVPTWSHIGSVMARRWPAVVFAPSTPYTVTGFPEMRHHALVRCETDEPASFSVRTRIFALACMAPESDALARQPGDPRAP